MTAGPQGASIAVAPPLSAIVELETPIYVYSGYHYWYDNDRWFYRQHERCPWIDLPRDRYPRDIRHRDKGHGHDKGKGWKR